MARTIADNDSESCGPRGWILYKIIEIPPRFIAANAPRSDARELHLAGKGFPGRGKHSAGDLFVRLQPVFPVRLDARQRKLLLQANAALLKAAEESLPEIAAWQREHIGS